MKTGKLKLGKGVAFVKSHLRRLRQEDETWQVDFRALPKPMTQVETRYIGFVVTDPDRILVESLEVETTPTVNDLATLLAHAMKRPVTESPYRPRRILVRKNPRWRELFPHLEELGIEVSTQNDLPQIDDEFSEYARHLKETRSAGKVKPSKVQAAIELSFPAIAHWVQGYGHIEIGDQEGFGFIVRAIDYGGVVFEDDRPSTLADAMAALETGLREWFDSEGIEIE
jgi:hypothetical protein